MWRSWKNSHVGVHAECLGPVCVQEPTSVFVQLVIFCEQISLKWIAIQKKLKIYDFTFHSIRRSYTTVPLPYQEIGRGPIRPIRWQVPISSCLFVSWVCVAWLLLCGIPVCVWLWRRTGGKSFLNIDIYDGTRTSSTSSVVRPRRQW